MKKKGRTQQKMCCEEAEEESDVKEKKGKIRAQPFLCAFSSLKLSAMLG